MNKRPIEAPKYWQPKMNFSVFPYFRLFYTVDSEELLGFKLQTSVVESNCCVHWVTVTAYPACFVKCTLSIMHRWLLWKTQQRPLTVGGGTAVQLVSSLASLDSTASLHTNNHIFSFWSNLILLNRRPAVRWFFPISVNVLCTQFREIWYPLSKKGWNFLKDGCPLQKSNYFKSYLKLSLSSFVRYQIRFTPRGNVPLWVVK